MIVTCLQHIVQVGVPTTILRPALFLLSSLISHQSVIFIPSCSRS